MLTMNEEFHLPGAIENVRDWAEDIFIVDSCSTDRTAEIAESYGAPVAIIPNGLDIPELPGEQKSKGGRMSRGSGGYLLRPRGVRRGGGLF